MNTWGAYASVTVGGEWLPLPLTWTGINPSGATKNYASTTGTVCSVLSNTGEVTGLNTGSCTIRLTLSNTGYVNTIPMIIPLR